MKHVPQILDARGGGVAARGSVAHYASLVAIVLYVMAVLLLAYLEDAVKLAVYALSFWHYFLYLLACVFAAVSLRVFKRDAVALKSISLLSLFTAYFAVPIDALSLAVVSAGFALNTVGAMALGSDRTYYGHEIAGLPHRRITAFPFSVMSHPMLMGNVLAYAGTLLNAEFRENWWPLACTHIALNAGLLVMERVLGAVQRDSPADAGRVSACRHSVAIIGLGMASVLGGGIALADGAAGLWLCAATSGSGAVLACVLYRSYRHRQM